MDATLRLALPKHLRRLAIGLVALLALAAGGCTKKGEGTSASSATKAATKTATTATTTTTATPTTIAGMTGTASGPAGATGEDLELDVSGPYKVSTMGYDRTTNTMSLTGSSGGGTPLTRNFVFGSEPDARAAAALAADSNSLITWQTATNQDDDVLEAIFNCNAVATAVNLNNPVLVSLGKGSAGEICVQVAGGPQVCVTLTAPNAGDMGRLLAIASGATKQTSVDAGRLTVSAPAGGTSITMRYALRP